MKMAQTLHLLFISGFCSFALGSSDFHLVERSRNYTEAKSYCREMYTDLATVHNLEDMNDLITLFSATTPRAWIGLEAGDVWTWHWSWPDQKLDFLNWKAEELQNNSQDACAVMDQRGEWFESECRTRRSFVCHGNNETSGSIFVAETKSWRDAQDHCRGLRSDLVSIHSAEENEAVRNVSASQDVWIGLFKDPWRWSDGSNTSFRYWKPNQPNYGNGQACVAAIFKDEGKWNDLNCNTRRNFVCQGASKLIPTSTSQTSTQETFTADPLPPNLTTLPSTSTHSDTTDVTTDEATTASDLTTPNTTDLVSSTSSTELSSANTEMSTVTATRLPPTATARVTTDGVSALTTLMGTSAQSTTQSSTLKPTGNSPSLHPGNLILIQENMTWIEAMTYCRKHHIDLVHITNEDIQEKVAEKAKQATSPHVWLGLRYTCKFNFWFWTSSTTVCYLNWAPGEGPEGEYDCGVTGAIQATGGQQWVGLPEMEKLNFICYACAG